MMLLRTNPFPFCWSMKKSTPGKFKAVHSEVNKRQGGAKNIGLSLAKGEWIGFIDSDDWILPTMYEKLIGRAEETGADMVGCDYCLTDEHSMKIGKRVENGKAEQSGVLGNKQCRSLILDSGSLVVRSIAGKFSWTAASAFRSTFFTRIMRSATRCFFTGTSL